MKNDIDSLVEDFETDEEGIVLMVGFGADTLWNRVKVPEDRNEE